MYGSILTFQRFRYLRLSVLVGLLAIAAYLFIVPGTGLRSGASWVGYTLGTIGALLILWLTWFGVRKRSYHSSGASVQSWLSAHVYFGTLLLLIASLHSGFVFGWDIHSLTYALMVLVIASGMVGVYSYQRFPRLIIAKRGKLTLDVVLARLAVLDRELVVLSRGEASSLAPQIKRVVSEPVVATTWWRQLRDSGRGGATTSVVQELQRASAGERSDHDAINAVLPLLQRRMQLSARLRREYQLKALLKVWLHVHVPLATALLAALTAHVLAVFYW